MSASLNTHFTKDPINAASFLFNGGLVVFPTETVYGLGANALDEEAVKRIYLAKGRPSSNPLIVHIGSFADTSRVADEINPLAQRLMKAFFPGPLTLILPRHPSLPKIVSGGLDTVAIRMPAFPLAMKFLKAAGIPVAAPSANISGRPSATTWQSAAEDLNHRVHCILCGPPATVGLESTVVDCTGVHPSLLRPGAIGIESLRNVVSEFSSAPPDTRRSPGMRYNHYAPTAQIRIVETPRDATPGQRKGYIGLLPPSTNTKFQACLIPSDINEYAHKLFEFFRECDRSGIRIIYCQRVAETDLGRALMDRLRHAAKSSM